MIKEETKLGIKGLHKFSICESTSKKAKEIEAQIDRVLRTISTPQARHLILNRLFKDLQKACLVNQFVVENIIPTVGRAVIAQWITGDNTYDADNGANYGSLGTDNTAPDNGDTTLTTETYRKATSSAATANNVAYLSNFYTATEVTGTFEEAGWHIDGGAGADTGQLLSHFLTGTIVKANTETLTVESTLTIS